jgi:MFS family permease
VGTADKLLAEPSPAALGAPPTWVRWRILALLLAFSFMSWFNRASMAAAGDISIMPQYGISKETMGTVYSAFLLVYAIFMTPGGWFIDRFGARLALIVMGFGSALFGALTGCVGFLSVGLIIPAFLVVRGLMGLLSAPIYPASGRIVSRWLPYPQRAMGNGLVTCAAPLGIACTFVGFGALIDWVGWPFAFLITGGITGLFAMLWAISGTNRPEEHPAVNAAEQRLIEIDEPAWSVQKKPNDELPSESEPKEEVAHPPATVGWSHLLSNRSLVLLTISYGAVSYFEYLFTFWMHHYFDDVLHLGEVNSRYYAGILYVAEAVGMALGGWLSDRMQQVYGYRRGRAIVPVAGMLLSAALLGLGLTASHPAAIVTWFALAVGAVGMCEGPFWATAIELGGRSAGTSAGICNTGGNVGGLIAPIITPWVAGMFGWLWGIGLGSLVCVAGATLWLGIDPAERVEKS